MPTKTKQTKKPEPISKPKKTAVKTSTESSKLSTKQRLLKRLPGRKSTEPKKPIVKLPSVWGISRISVARLWSHKGLFIWITLIYGIFDVVFAEAAANTTNIQTLKQNISQAFAGHAASIGSSFKTFFSLSYDPTANTNGTGTPAGLLQFIFIVVVALALIWAFRHAYKEEKVRIRDAFYRGMYPLIPFLIVMLIIGLQLIPIVIGSTLYLQTVDNGIAVGELQKLFWELIFFLFSIVSLYMISASLLAIFVVTLPGMTPIRAVKKAGKLVQRQRLVVFSKFLFLVVALFVVGIAVMVPVVEWLTPLTQIVYFLLTIFAVPLVLSYGYTIFYELSEGNE